LIRSLPVRSSFGLSVYLAASHPLDSRLRFVPLEMTERGDWNGNTYCTREKLANTTHLIFMAEPYPSYPCNPWLFETSRKSSPR
jgi:hypothetical protein